MERTLTLLHSIRGQLKKMYVLEFESVSKADEGEFKIHSRVLSKGKGSSEVQEKNLEAWVFSVVG